MNGHIVGKVGRLTMAVLEPDLMGEAHFVVHGIGESTVVVAAHPLPVGADVLIVAVRPDGVAEVVPWPGVPGSDHTERN